MRNLFAEDQVRNSALAMAEEHHAISNDNAELNLRDEAKDVIDSMVLFERGAALKLAEKQKNNTRSVRMASIQGKLNAQGSMDMGASSTYAEAQNKDMYYD